MDRILVVGGGPAGVNAALLLAKQGEKVTLIDQASNLGGAIYAQYKFQKKPDNLPKTPESFKGLLEEIEKYKDKIEVYCNSRYIGIDYQGTAMISGEANCLIKPKAIIFATGGRENVWPRKGWDHFQVTTVGALQIQLKTTALVPKGSLMLAGNGPLLLACGAQLAKAGNPPKAILLSSNPFKPLQFLKLPLSIMFQSLAYFITLIRHRVPVLTNTKLNRIEPTGKELTLHIKKKKEKEITTDKLALHDGLRTQKIGLNPSSKTPQVFAGDGWEVLGDKGAAFSGQFAAIEVLKMLGKNIDDAMLNATKEGLKKAREIQKTLGKMFNLDDKPDFTMVDKKTIICRCEQKSYGDLKSINHYPFSPKMIRLQERFGMGACQGRFCLDTLAEIYNDDKLVESMKNPRWPSVPITIKEFLNAYSLKH